MEKNYYTIVYRFDKYSMYKLFKTQYVFPTYKDAHKKVCGLNNMFNDLTFYIKPIKCIGVVITRD